jgi:hypothetical protein
MSGYKSMKKLSTSSMEFLESGALLTVPFEVIAAQLAMNLSGGFIPGIRSSMVTITRLLLHQMG